MSWVAEMNGEIWAAHHVQLFIPEVDRLGAPVPLGQEHWTERALEVLGKLFGGATAFPQGRGVWFDDDSGILIRENTVIVISYVREEHLTAEAQVTLREFLFELGRETGQGEVGLLVDGTYVGFRDFSEGRQDE